MISLKQIKPKRDENGFYMHPEIPWDRIPEEALFESYFEDWGNECIIRAIEEDSEELSERYFASNEPDCSYWEPKPPSGEGWILIGIFDSEYYGVISCWLRPLQDQ